MGHPVLHPPPSQNGLIQNVNSAKTETCWARVRSGSGDGDKWVDFGNTEEVELVGLVGGCAWSAVKEAVRSWGHISIDS